MLLSNIIINAYFTFCFINVSLNSITVNARPSVQAMIIRFTDGIDTAEVSDGSYINLKGDLLNVSLL